MSGSSFRMDRMRSADHLAEITRLRAELATHSVTWGDLPSTLREAEVWEPHEWDNMNPTEQRDAAIAELDRVTRELANARKDTARLDWVQDNGWPEDVAMDHPQTLRDCIDAARGQE